MLNWQTKRVLLVHTRRITANSAKSRRPGGSGLGRAGRARSGSLLSFLVARARREHVQPGTSSCSAALASRFDPGYEAISPARLFRMVPLLRFQRRCELLRTTHGETSIWHNDVPASDNRGRIRNTRPEPTHPSCRLELASTPRRADELSRKAPRDAVSARRGWARSVRPIHACLLGVMQ